MRLTLALLAAGLVLLALHDVNAHPAGSPFISIPISRIGSRTDVLPLPPTIVHQQHANRAIRRFEHLTGSHTHTSDDVLLANLQRRAAALPAHIQKRFYHPGLDLLHRLSIAGKHAPDSPVSNAQARPATFKADGDVREGVTPGRKPTFPHTIALDIQSKDIGYIGKVQIGTPPRDFMLLMDSGSADLWVGAEGCQDDDLWDDFEGCGDHTFLGPESSSTFNDTKKPWKIEYGTGAVSGTLVTDNIAIAGMKLPNHKFGVAKNESREFTPDYIPFDGLAGFAKSDISRQGTITLVEALHQAGRIPRAIVSYHIPRLADGHNYGELTLGALNPARYRAETLVQVRNISPFGFWEARVESVRVGGKDMRWKNRTAIFDTGTTLLVAPKADVDAIHRHIPGAWYDPDPYGLGTWTVPCVPAPSSSKKPVFALTLGGRAFNVDARDIPFLPIDEADPQGNCTSGITAGDIGGAEQWLVGDVFLKNVYMSTDVGSDMISFAKLKPASGK
ncbi:hypothetical protein D9615_004313 [Tricholomella constricta]|uniref:Peptidase A1 domain-containing protein n=1 Tax=Tricholomella constricta TaxID=117010 RepID=A0A8H5M5K4_9AGAR|nr:hypothetical protein D9615_004313 [Tricholomella constricta]